MIQEVNGTRLYYEEYGSGDQVILSCAQVFDPDRIGWPFDLAEEGFHVVALQMRGYGNSEHIYSDFEHDWYSVWAEDAAQFARALGIERFLYTGQADGAGVGWNLCFQHPELLAGFAALSGGPHSRQHTQMNAVRKRNMEALENQDLAIQLAQYQRQRILQFAQKFAYDPVLKAEFENKAEKFYQWQMEKTPEEKLINPGIPLCWFQTDEELLKGMRELKVPVLLLNGMKDAMVPLNHTVMTVGDIPRAKAVYYQDGTCLLHYGYRDDVRREITAFAREIFA